MTILAAATVTAHPGEVIGRVRLTVPSAAVPLVLGTILPPSIARHPQEVVDVRVENAFVNVVGEGLDAGMRLVEAIDRDMVHVRLTGPARFVVAGAPSYLGIGRSTGATMGGGGVERARTSRKSQPRCSYMFATRSVP